MWQYKALLNPHEIAETAFQVIGKNSLGHITPALPNRNSYIFVITYYFSPWVEAVALKDQTTKMTTEYVNKTIFVRHGMPKAIVSNRRINFTSKSYRYFSKKLKINKG